jgi:hypothetical protein
MLYNYHECDQKPERVYINIDRLGNLESACMNVNTRDNDNETCHRTTIYRIQYCPYCGKKLIDEVEQ